MRLTLTILLIAISPWAFAKDPKPVPNPHCTSGNDGTCTDQPAASGQVCPSDTNRINFNVNGTKDYFVGRDLLNKNGGWYFSAQDGEIVVPNPDGKGGLCVQNGTRPEGTGDSNLDNSAGTPKCDGAISGKRTVDVSDTPDGATKESVWQWHPKSGDSDAYLTITPVDAQGNNLNPTLRITGSISKPGEGDAEKMSGMTVEADTIPGSENSGSTPKKWVVAVETDRSKTPSAGKEIPCSLGKLDNTKDVSYRWDKDKNYLVDGDGKRVTSDTSAVATR